MMKTVLDVRGSSSTNLVHDIRFEGLTFEDSDFTDWYRFGWPQAGQSGERHFDPSFDRQIDLPQNRLGLVRIENTEQVDINFSHLKNGGFGGLTLFNHNKRDCFYGNAIEHSGVDGILLQGAYPGEGDVLRENVFSNNRLIAIIEITNKLLNI